MLNHFRTKLLCLISRDLESLPKTFCEGEKTVFVFVHMCNTLPQNWAEELQQLGALVLAHNGSWMQLGVDMLKNSKKRERQRESRVCKCLQRPSNEYQFNGY